MPEFKEFILFDKTTLVANTSLVLFEPSTQEGSAEGDPTNPALDSQAFREATAAGIYVVWPFEHPGLFSAL